MTLLSRRDALQFGGAALVATTLLGAGSRSLLARQDEPVTLTFWHYYGGAHTASLEAVLQKYMDEHPGVTIEARLVNFPDFNRTLLQSAAAGDLPDIALINAFDTQMLAEAGIITDLTERATEWGGTGNYFPGIYETSLWDGKNYGLPHLADAYVLWYNKDIFEEAGLEPPKTWDELRETAQTLSGDGRFGIAMCAVEGLEGATAYVLRLLAAGGDITDIDSDAGREAMQELVGLVESGSMSPGILGWLEDDVATQFATGQAAMMINSASYVNYFRSEYPELNSGLALMPADEASTTFLNAEHLTIASGSENADAAWDLIVWMQQPEVLNDYLPKRNKLPALKNVAEEPQWADDPVWSVFTSQLEDAWAPTGNVATNSAEILTYIQEAVQASVSGDSTIDEALAAAQVKIDEALAD